MLGAGRFDHFARTGVVAPVDLSVLAVAPVGLLQEPARRSSKGSVTRVRIREQFSLQRVTERL
ncbi:MAG: hypothetical protein QF890_03455 [Myxococcota bacterium]|jgi:hypothetical protein|nr:hypothetical protein [bacterium]MDP7074494.1 hypothetical protein [Myxococcota bacterium]MDP7431611.1 hypothetical protein [Myxococcota bacterium]